MSSNYSNHFRIARVKSYTCEQLTLSNYGEQNTTLDSENYGIPKVKNKLAACKALSFEKI